MKSENIGAYFIARHHQVVTYLAEMEVLHYKKEEVNTFWLKYVKNAP
jgi:hypothetical protein